MPPAFPPQELREKRDGRDGEEFEVRGFRNFEPRTSNFGSRPSRMSRASRATVCGAGELFNILIERMHLVKSLSKVTGPGWMARSLTGYHPVPIIIALRP